MTDFSVLFEPFVSEKLTLPNRIAMAPMTRLFSPGGVPGAGVAAYYRRRAEGGTGLIITEGTFVPHWGTTHYDDNAPHFFGDEALAAWRVIADEVHAGGGKIMPQLWHVGLVQKPVIDGMTDGLDAVEGVGPSGLLGRDKSIKPPMTDSEIADVIEAFATAALSAKQIGFDGVEVHGAHGYLLDQFMWGDTNARDDRWGGDFAQRTYFVAELVRGIRARVGPDYPIVLRYSQWKQQDYDARLAETPEELEKVLTLLTDAGVDIYHCSQRRFWVPEFDGSDMNLAGWTKRLSGKPTISVGSVGLDQEFLATFYEEKASGVARFDKLETMMSRGDFDIIALGRVLISDPTWPEKVRRGAFDELLAYDRDHLATLD